MSTTEDRMVEYALNLSYDELPDQAIHQLKRRLIDTLGGGTGGLYRANSSNRTPNRLTCRPGPRRQDLGQSYPNFAGHGCICEWLRAAISRYQ